MEKDILKKFKKELKYLQADIRDKEYNKYKKKIKTNDDIIKYSKEIYNKIGIDYNMLSSNAFNKFIYDIKELIGCYKIEDSKTKFKMILEILYIIFITILIKIPFDFVRDLSYNYFLIIKNGYKVFYLWKAIFLTFYIVTIVCVIIVLINNFNKKYKTKD